MLHYYGDKLALELGDAAKRYIELYQKQGEEICKVAFFDLEKNRKRFVKFQLLAGVWCFVDLTD
jgi:hypothetical protein